MGQFPRLRVAAGALLAALLLAGCGGSVADADQVERPRRVEPPSPFCLAVQANSDAIRPLNTMVGGGQQPADLAGTVDEVRRTGAELQRQAPDEIRSDVERTVRAVNLQLDVLLANGGDAGAMARDPDLVAELSSPELASAGERYRAYVARTCTAAEPGRGQG